MAEAMFEVVLPDFYAKNFNQISNLFSLKKYLIYLLSKLCFWKPLKIWVLPFFSWNWKKILLTRIHSVDSEEQLNQFFSSQKRFSVPCVFTCFKYLISPAKIVKGNGELFDKRKLALTYSAQPVAANLDFLGFTAIKKQRFPNLLLSATSTYKQTSPKNQNASKNLLQLGDRTELITQLRLLHHQQKHWKQLKF